MKYLIDMVKRMKLASDHPLNFAMNYFFYQMLNLLCGHKSEINIFLNYYVGNA